MDTSRDYMDSSKDPSRFYRVCEAPDEDGWMVCWHAQGGDTHHYQRRLRFETNEEACEALEKLAFERQMRHWVYFDKPLSNGQTGNWQTVGQPRYGADALAERNTVYKDPASREGVLLVQKGLGDTYGTFRALPGKGPHRKKSPALPMVGTREEAQRNLDAYAQQHRLQALDREAILDKLAEVLAEGGQ